MELYNLLSLTTNHSHAYNRPPWVSSQSEIANHQPGKPDTVSKHASANLDMLSQHAKCRQAIPACIAKVTVYKGLQEPKTVDKL